MAAWRVCRVRYMSLGIRGQGTVTVFAANPEYIIILRNYAPGLYENEEEAIRSRHLFDLSGAIQSGCRFCSRGDDPDAPQRTRVCRSIHRAHAQTQRANRGGFSRSVVQFYRETASSRSAAARQLWQGGPT